MEITTDKSPWPHFIVSDFLNSEMYQVAKQIHERFTGKPSAGSRNTVRLKRRVNHYLYDQMETNFLSLLDRVGLPDISGEVVVEFDALGINYQYPPHTDIASKVASFVYHISEQGSGTKLLNDKQPSSIKTLPWIVNGGGGFIRTANSWHMFDNIGFSSIRRTILFTLRK
jgi:hypothetical protein